MREYIVPSGRASSAVGAGGVRVRVGVEAASALTGPTALLEPARYVSTIATSTTSSWKNVALGFGLLFLLQAVLELVAEDLFQLSLRAGASERQVSSTIQSSLQALSHSCPVFRNRLDDG